VLGVFVCVQYNSKKYEWILLKYFGEESVWILMAIGIFFSGFWIISVRIV